MEMSPYLELLKSVLIGSLLAKDGEDRRRAEDAEVVLSKCAWTMIGRRRLESLEEQIRQIVHDGIDGDLIEAGVWRGGACIFMRAVLLALGDEKRHVVLADSFQGLPRPDPASYPEDRGDRHHEESLLRVGLERVRDSVQRFGFLDSRSEFVPGWFRDTLPTLTGRRWSLVRLDADMYEGTILGLRHLYPGLSVGGYLVVDDYGDRGKEGQAKKAAEDYRIEHGITDPIEWIDRCAVAWRKS